MMKVLSKFFKDMFTGRDNRTYDIGRVLWFQSVQAFILISLYSIHKGGQFDPVLWGAGLAALITGGGASLSMKHRTEPSYTEQVAKAAEDAARIKRAAREARDADKDDHE